ncbi:MAG: bifunctional (p)ppGpp synthetase/guanosine-3',5'-bis(diphosphate) 3'-pyrophosphohydrolase [Methylococcales bacterium]|nr:bifunctional (p)ppGpp synthetase/guanosine-3',5'-bis(diphosphate) 3'-pyrophosphohydrolase [Methylococcaceae bacterium]
MHKNTSPDSSSFTGFPEAGQRLLDQALLCVAKIPDDPDYQRPKGVQVAAILRDFNVDTNTLVAAILSDPRLTKLVPIPDIKEQFGETIATLVKDVNWLNTVTVYTPDMASQPNQSETLRRMLLSMTQDVRAVLIKLAYRIQRLHGLSKESPEVRHFIAQETLDIYAPIANRLGVHQLKWELEDMAFRYMEPKAYREIAHGLSNKRKHRVDCIRNFIEEMQQKLADEGIPCECYGRPKHIYSIWKKMQRKQLPLDELYDLLAVRVIVDNLTQCYAALGLVHSGWQTIPKEFDDYIANPKENGYQSLHTVILDAQGNRIEVQIRTREMHDFAELGVAAHWAYKEGGKQNAAMEKSVATLRRLLEDKASDEAFSENFRSELFNDRVYVLTPAGKLIDLVKGATPLDFAYAVHTEIGHRCRGAKINGRIVPLTTVLKSGEQVEILTAKEGAPNRHWIDAHLGYLKTASAIGKVKSWFKNQQQTQNIAAGKAILEKESQRLGIKAVDVNELARHFKQADVDKLFEAIGRSDINSRQLATFFKIPELETSSLLTRQQKTVTKSLVTVNGMDNVMTSFAQCCNPVQGDDIIGYISHLKGITVHRKSCPNMAQLEPQKRDRLISVSWGMQKASHAVPIVIKAFNAQNLLVDVSQVLAQAKIHISNAALHSHPDFSADLDLTIQVENTDQLSQVLNKLSQLTNIVDVKRKT